MLGYIQKLKTQNDKKNIKRNSYKRKNNKTIVVEVVRKFKHPFMKKLSKDLKNIMLMMKKINLKKVKKFQLLKANLFKKKTWQVLE